MSQPSPTELAWAAGIIEGEGCFGIGNRSKKDRHLRPKIVVGNTDRAMTDQLRYLFGGSIWYRDRDFPRKPMWTWTVACKKAIETIRSISPYMVTKRDQAALVLKVGRTAIYGGKGNKVPDSIKEEREDLRQRLYDLKHEYRKEDK